MFQIFYSWSDLKPIRSSIIITGIFQIIGSIIGWRYLTFPELFDKLWFGGVFLTLPGLLIGLVFLKHTSPDAIRNNALMVKHTIFVASLLTLGAVWLYFDRVNIN